MACILCQIKKAAADMNRCAHVHRQTVKVNLHVDAFKHLAEVQRLAYSLRE